MPHERLELSRKSWVTMMMVGFCVGVVASGLAAIAASIAMLSAAQP